MSIHETIKYEKPVKYFKNCAKRLGIKDAEFFVTGSDYFVLNVQDQKFEQFKFSKIQGSGIRVIINGRAGYAYTESLEKIDIEQTLMAAREMAEILPDEEHSVRVKGFRGNICSKAIKVYNPGLNDVSEQQKIDAVMKAERAALSHDSRVEKVLGARYSDGNHFQRIVNTKGMDRFYASNYCMMSVSALAKDGKERQSEGHYVFSRDFNELDPDFIGTTAAKRAVRKLGSKPLRTGKYNVAFDNEIMADIIGAFSSIFSARSAQLGRSLLNEKLNQRVAATKLTILDDAAMPDGLVSHPFDDEGHPVKKLYLIRKGVFRNFLHNIYSADIWGVKSTGHAARSGGYKNTLGIAPSNMFIQPGTLRFTEIMNKRKKIIHISSVQGLAAGLNPVTGDFSLSATGFIYENGKVKHPVHNFTVAGNILELFMNIIEIGGDFKFGSPSGVSSFGAPTVLFRNVSISGEK